MDSESRISDCRVLRALFPAARRRIFCALFAEPDRWWSIEELAGRTGVRFTSVQQTVASLRKGGLVREKTFAGNLLLQPNPMSAIFAEVRSIISKLSVGMPVNAPGGTILVAEDQAATARITKILLESWGYRVLEARGAREAVSVFEKHHGTIVLLLADVIMPDMSGPQLADELRMRNPALRVIFMSGSAMEEGSRRGAPFLPKPFTPESLSRIIRSELNQLKGGSREEAQGMNNLLD
jgi:CheY-like chemotaxis protein